jgi:hypothetical protein
MTWPRFGLKALIIALTVCCALAYAVRYLGVGPTLVIVGGGLLLVLLVTAWCLAYSQAPVLTRHATVFLAIVLLTTTLAARWLVQSREDSRRATTGNRLREMHRGMAEQRERHPGNGSITRYSAEALD